MYGPQVSPRGSGEVCRTALPSAGSLGRVLHLENGRIKDEPEERNRQIFPLHLADSTNCLSPRTPLNTFYANHQYLAALTQDTLGKGWLGVRPVQPDERARSKPRGREPRTACTVKRGKTLYILFESG